MLHEKFIEFSSVNNLSYQRTFINRFSISERIEKLMFVAQHISQKLLDFWRVKDGACFASSHALFTLTMAALTSDRASITISDIAKKSVKGLGCDH